MSHYKTQSLTIGNLMVAISNQPRLVTLNWSVWTSFKSKNPFTWMYIHVRFIWNQRPSRCPLQRIEFICHLLFSILHVFVHDYNMYPQPKEEQYVVRFAYLGLGLWIPLFARVVIGWENLTSGVVYKYFTTGIKGVIVDDGIWLWEPAMVERQWYS